MKPDAPAIDANGARNPAVPSIVTKYSASDDVAKSRNEKLDKRCAPDAAKTAVTISRVTLA
jgi:hypothetical protein